MATTTRVEVLGLRELGAKMRQLSEKMNKRIAARATGRAAKVIKDAAKRNVISNNSKNATAVDTGSLRDSIVSKKLRKSETPDTSAHIVAVRTMGSLRKTGGKNRRKQRTAPHASLVEFGTVHMPAEPFMRPAFDHKSGDALNEMVKTLRDGIEDAL
jgi:HK97 gp10 family phage protein